MSHAVGGRSQTPITFSPDGALVNTALDTVATTAAVTGGKTGRMGRLPGVAIAAPVGPVSETARPEQGVAGPVGLL